MTGNTLGWVIVAFVLYLLMMIAIGAFYAKGNNNSEDYFLGGNRSFYPAGSHHDTCPRMVTCR